MIDRLVDRASKMRLGHGLDPKTDVGPVINGRQLNKIHEYTQIGIQEGAKLLIGGESGDTVALRRHSRDRQRPPGGGLDCPGPVHRVGIGVRGLLREAPESPDRLSGLSGKSKVLSG